MPRNSFNPNALTFDEGIARIKEAVESVELDTRRIVTSRDEASIKLKDVLETENIPDGFKKWQLPVYLDRACQLFISVGNPGTYVPPHSHDEGDGIRFIMGGSVIFEGQELTQGDWMFIPEGCPYSMEVGPHGALMCYCYCCSCA